MIITEWRKMPKLRIPLQIVLIIQPNFLKRRDKNRKQSLFISRILRLLNRKNLIRKIEGWLIKPELRMRFLKRTKTSKNISAYSRESKVLRISSIGRLKEFLNDRIFLGIRFDQISNLIFDLIEYLLIQYQQYERQKV